MPQTKNPIERYLILDRCLRDMHRFYTLESLLDVVNRQLRYSSGNIITKRTLQKDISDMEYKFAVDFNETLRNRRPAIYRYENPSTYYQFIQLNNVDYEKIQDAINVLSAYEGIPQYDWARMLLTEAQMCNETNASGRVEFQNNPDLQGLQYFSMILDAITAKQLLTINYQPYDRQGIDYNISPLRLKQYNNRWYLIGKSLLYENISLFPLDRIKSIKLAKGKYEEADINLDELFEDQIGISLPRQGEKVEDVILRITKKRYHYIETKPLHWSQTELKEHETETTKTIRIRVYINKELTQQLLSFGEDLVVLAPEQLRKEIKDKISALNQKYQ